MVSMSELTNTTNLFASLTRMPIEAFFASRVTLYVIFTAMGSSKRRPDLSLPAEVTLIASNPMGLSETSGSSRIHVCRVVRDEPRIASHHIAAVAVANNHTFVDPNGSTAEFANCSEIVTHEQDCTSLPGDLSHFP